MIRQAFNDPGIKRAFATTMAVNTRSRRVLQKLGMTHTSTWIEQWDDPIPGSRKRTTGGRSGPV